MKLLCAVALFSVASAAPAAIDEAAAVKVLDLKPDVSTDPGCTDTHVFQEMAVTRAGKDVLMGVFTGTYDEATNTITHEGANGLHSVLAVDDAGAFTYTSTETAGKCVYDFSLDGGSLLGVKAKNELVDAGIIKVGKADATRSTAAACKGFDGGYDTITYVSYVDGDTTVPVFGFTVGLDNGEGKGTTFGPTTILPSAADPKALEIANGTDAKAMCYYPITVTEGTVLGVAAARRRLR